MKNNRDRASALTYAAFIAAAYVVLTLALAPISYGALQFRLSEVLCILPFFIPGASTGLLVGCLIANVFSGNALDIVFGSLATHIAALITAFCGRKGRSVGYMAAGCAAPVVINAVVVGCVITRGFIGLPLKNHFPAYLLNILQVGLGETVVLFGIGLPLMLYLSKKSIFEKISTHILPEKTEEN